MLVAESARLLSAHYHGSRLLILYYGKKETASLCDNVHKCITVPVGGGGREKDGKNVKHNVGSEIKIKKNKLRHIHVTASYVRKRSLWPVAALGQTSVD